MVDGQGRDPGFRAHLTLERYGAVFDVKNKQSLSVGDGGPAHRLFAD
jgi:hypothetical protein